MMLLQSATVLAFVNYAQTVSLAVVFGKAVNEPINATKELVALGAAAPTVLLVEEAAQVLIGVIHDLLGTYVLLHVGSIVVVGGAKVPLNAGGFDTLSVGNAGGPVQSGDRVLFVPKTAEDVACGPTTYAVVP